MSIVWPCSLTVDAYALLGRAVNVPRPDCPSCSSPVVFWSGYWRYVRLRCCFLKVFIRRVRCRACGVTHALPPWRLHAWPGGWMRPRTRARSSGRSLAVRAGSARPRHERRCRIRRRGAKFAGSLPGPGELAVSFSALAAELGGEVIGLAWLSCQRAAVAIGRCFYCGGRAAGMGAAGAVAVRLRGDRREPAGRQRNLALADHRQAAFHALRQEPMTREDASWR